MSYLEKIHVEKALRNMKIFHEDLLQLHDRYGLDLLDNLGRRNVLMSSIQEAFFSRVLSESFYGVVNNGKTGEPDIVIGQLGTELECKLTTPSKSGKIALQTDYVTLTKKGKLDYLYVIADEKFEKFVVLFYNNLTNNDFRVPSSGSRGKASLVKHVAQDKCSILWGNVVEKNQLEIDNLQKRLATCSSKAVKTKESIIQSIEYWKTTPTSFTYEFEGVV
jgi:hypothetical protein